MCSDNIEDSIILAEKIEGKVCGNLWIQPLVVVSINYVVQINSVMPLISFVFSS